MNQNPDPFIEQRAGRVPISTAFGSAATVVGEGNPMRPDRSYNVLWYLSVFGGLLGLDHFYLRSPFSGLFKALTGGGFLIWWLWDMFQVMTEKERIVLYGMSAPFDLKRGYGQGTIAEGETRFYQRSDSALWFVAAIFSFLGADALLRQNWAEFFRKLTEGAVFCVLVWSLTTTWAENGIDGLATVGNVFKILLAVMFGLIVIYGWVSVMYPTFFKPETLMTDGIKISRKMSDILNFPSLWVRNLKYFFNFFSNGNGANICERIMKDIGYADITGEDMNRAFKVRFKVPIDPTKSASEQKAEDDDAEDATSTETADNISGIWWSSPASYIVYLLGPLMLIAQAILWAITEFIAYLRKQSPLGKLQTGIEGATKVATALSKGNIGAAVGDLAATAASASGVPIPSGITNTVEMATKAASTVEKAKGIASNPLAAMAGAAGVSIDQIIPPNIHDAAAAITQKGGARHEEPTSQGMILGASVFALAGGAAIKLAVDYLLPSQ